MTSCPACAAKDYTSHLESLLRCRRCQHVVAAEVPPPAELERLYQDAYFQGAEYSDYLAEERILRKNFALRAAVLLRFADPQKHRHLVEIGCAHGFFLDTIRSSFASSRGFEVSESAAHYAREHFGLDVTHGDFLDAETVGPIDVACFWDTIEHLAEPQRFIEKIAQHAPSGALVAVSTGDIQSFNARLRGRRWRLIHPPTHLQYFSAASLRRLLGRYGFGVIHQEHCGYYRSLDAMAHNILMVGRKAPRLYALLHKSGLVRRDLYLNLGDILFVIARKH